MTRAAHRRSEIKHMRLLTFLLVSFVLGKRYSRLFYLDLYEDEPADEFLETLQPNMDGSTFLDDSYFLFLETRYQWRKGAENFDPIANEPRLSEDEYLKQLGMLQTDHVSLSTPLPLIDVIEEEWRYWANEPDFPTKEQIAQMGIEELIKNGGTWADGQSIEYSESSQSGASIEEASVQDQTPEFLEEGVFFADEQ